MHDLQERLNALIKPGTTGGKVFYGTAFFIVALMFVCLGFWKTMLVLVLTAMGVLIGSADTLGKAVAKVVDRIIPPKNQKVVYTAEDMEKVKNATRPRQQTTAQGAAPGENLPEQDNKS
ncbi:MAG: DUF2273 domain-containing protein [Eubacteriales bacterium]|nr:DUF2273 domain-containing protein [Eubacteriales bacterium]MDD4134923.1 DUF2273 domain-containing protein [Eubacteriales bacterium]